MSSPEIDEQFHDIVRAQDIEPQHLLWKAHGLHDEVPHLEPESETGKLAVSLHDKRSQTAIALCDAQEEARILEDNEARPQVGFYELSLEAIHAETRWRYFMNMYCDIFRRIGADRYEPEPLSMPYEKIVDKACGENIGQAQKEFGKDDTGLVDLINNIGLSYLVDSGLHFQDLEK